MNGNDKMKIGSYLEKNICMYCSAHGRCSGKTEYNCTPKVGG